MRAAPPTKTWPGPASSSGLRSASRASAASASARGSPVGAGEPDLSSVEPTSQLAAAAAARVDLGVGGLAVQLEGAPFYGPLPRTATASTSRAVSLTSWSERTRDCSGALGATMTAA